MKPQPTASALGPYVDALLQCTGQLMLIVNHMAAYPSAPDAAPPEEVLRALLLSALEPEVGRRPEIDVAAAAAIVAETVDVVGRELFFVEPGAFGAPECEVAPARRRRRPR